MSQPDPTPLTVVPPDVSVDQIARDLRALTQTLVEGQHAEDYIGGVLGGEYGYGTHFSNDTFEMHPFYWGDCECGRDEAEAHWENTHTHASACYQQVIRERGFLDFDAAADLTYQERSAHNDKITVQVCAEMGLDPEFGRHVHCTCTHTADYVTWTSTHPHDPTCGLELPNFRHKPTSSTVNFYKYIGRGMDVSLHASWATILSDCLRSLNQHPQG